MLIIRTVGNGSSNWRRPADNPAAMAAQSPLLRSKYPLIASLLREYLHEIDIDIKLCWKYTTYVQMRDNSACGFGVISLISITHLCKVSRSIGRRPESLRKL